MKTTLLFFIAFKYSQKRIFYRLWIKGGDSFPDWKFGVAALSTGNGKDSAFEEDDRENLSVDIEDRVAGLPKDVPDTEDNPTPRSDDADVFQEDIDDGCWWRLQFKWKINIYASNWLKISNNLKCVFQFVISLPRRP